MTGTRCCDALIITITHRAPSWHSCASCGQPVTIKGHPVCKRDGCSLDWKPQQKLWKCPSCGVTIHQSSI